MSKPDQDGKGKWMNYLGLSVLAFCYVGAIWNVISVKRQEQRADVIRLVHWQLELGVRDGLQALIDKYEAFKASQGKAVEVVQIPIPERAYNQYVTTQLIGGTAPDMIQLGKFQEEYLGRYFYPLSRHLQNPNPFLAERLRILRSQESLTPEENRELDAMEVYADRPWMDSFTDGLRGQFVVNFQEYFGVGFSTFTVRMYYNKDIFRKVLGHDRPPKTYDELLEVCRKISDYAEENKLDIQPVASSKYQVGVFKSRYLDELTADLNREYDLDLNGLLDGYEKLMAILRGDLTPWNVQYKAAIEVVQNLAEFFPKGFMSMGREDSGFSFVQGRAGMITSGSWDALSYLKKIEDQPEERRFDVGIFDLPSIDKNHPLYGAFADGRGSEASAGTGFAFGITRFTRHFDLCIEFLQYATTPQMNTEVNKIAGWIPVVHGATTSDMLEAFEPDYTGYFGQTRFEVMGGGKLMLLEEQLYWPLISGDFDYATYAERLWQEGPPEAATDYKRMYEGSRESIPNRQIRRSAFLANVVFGAQDPESRATREIQLQRTLQPLLGYRLEQKTADRMMELNRPRIPEDEKIQTFNENFFKALQREMNQ